MSNKKIVETLKNGIVFFDFDGVLVKYPLYGTKNGINPNEKWIEHCVITGYNENIIGKSEPMQVIVEIIQQLDKGRVYVLSATESSFEQNIKLKYLDKYFPDIRKENVIFVARSEYKKIILGAIYKSKLSLQGFEEQDVIMVEDTLSVIEDIERNTNFRCFHITALIP